MELPIKLNPKFSSKKAHEMQRQLSKKLVFEDNLPREINYVAGVDVGYINDYSVAAVAVLEYPNLSLVESQTVHSKTRFPYVPTFLSFREIPPAYSAIQKLEHNPDVFLVDGQGFAHPYGLGFASHLGLILNEPTVGVAKSLLCGKVEQQNEGNRFAVLKDNNNVVIGAVVVTRQGTKPVYVSVGHRVSLNRAVSLVLSCSPKLCA